MKELKIVWFLVRIALVAVLHFLWVWTPMVFAVGLFINGVVSAFADGDVWAAVFKCVAGIGMVLMYPVVFYSHGYRAFVGVCFYSLFSPVLSYRQWKDRRNVKESQLFDLLSD